LRNCLFTAQADFLVAASPSDLDLFLDLKAGKASALEALYDLYGNIMYALAFRILNNAQEAEDLVQEVFLSIWNHCTYQPERGSFKTFLVMLARSRALDRLRSQSARTHTLHRSGHSFEEVTYNGPLESALSDEVFQRVQAALNTLPEQQRQALEMSYFGGMTQLEISQSLNVPLGTVKSWFRLGFTKLRHALKDLINPSQNV
jgi:RNA polymerase sigma-70 factor, ECF subfamily